MSQSPHHRKLSDQLRAWPPERLAALVDRRPDLAGAAERSIPELAERAQAHASVVRAVGGTTLAGFRLLQVLVCCEPSVTVERFATRLPSGVTVADVEPVLDDLETAALVWRHGDRLHCSGVVRQYVATPFGPPLTSLLDGQSAEYLTYAIGNVRASVAAAVPDLAPPGPAGTIGPGGRVIQRQADLVGQLVSLLDRADVVAALLDAAPPDARAVIEALSRTHRPYTTVDHPLHYSARTSPQRWYYREFPTYWLYEHGLLLPMRRHDMAAVPREVGLALRGGRPIDDLALVQPALAVATADPAAVDAAAAERAQLTLDRLADVLDGLRTEPARQLKSGGLGATVLKQLAAALDVDLAHAARLLELLGIGGLVGVESTSRRTGRSYTYDEFVVPAKPAAGWLDRPAVVRWRQLAQAWLRAERWPSLAGHRDGDDKLVPALVPQFRAGMASIRWAALAALLHLDEPAGPVPSGPAPATTPAALASFVHWHYPGPWLEVDDPPPGVALPWILEEAELLGIAADGRLSSFGRALLDGDDSRAEQLFVAALPRAASGFTIQADLTAVVVGRLEREPLTELRLLADVESKGAATTYRFGEAGIRRALDAGRSVEEILAFLDAHATRGVPQALGYLVADVGRRHGHLRVGKAASYVLSDDPAVLADACSHRRTKKLALRLLAPTVAVSTVAPAKVIEALREAGFLPAADEDGTVTVSRPVAEPTGPTPARPGPSGLHAVPDGGYEALPEPYRVGARPGAPHAGSTRLTLAIPTAGDGGRDGHDLDFVGRPFGTTETRGDQPGSGTFGGFGRDDLGDFDL